MLLTAGERISMALLSMAIIDLGRQAISFTGSQAGIVTDTSHGKAKIIEVRARRVREAIEAGKIAIVAGFQGVSTEDDVTTLGRGGSDTTAVALAAALGADVCEIYTDVEGVFTADPRIVPERAQAARGVVRGDARARGVGRQGADDALGRVRAQPRRRHPRPLDRSREAEGTWVRKEEELMEQPTISGIAHDTSEAKVTISGVPDRPGIAARVFRPLADAGVNIDMIVQNVSEAGHTDISFTAAEARTCRGPSRS